LVEASKALEIDPDLPDALFVMGCVCEDQQMYAAAGRKDAALKLVAATGRADHQKFGFWPFMIPATSATATKPSAPWSDTATKVL
jgi:hypothetical protein